MTTGIRYRSYSEGDVDVFFLPPSQNMLKQITDDLTRFIQSENFEKLAGPRDAFKKKLEAIKERSNGDEPTAFYLDLPDSPGYSTLYTTLIAKADELKYIDFMTKRIFLAPETDQMEIINFLLKIDLSPAREKREDKRQTSARDQWRGDRHIEDGFAFLNQQISR